VSKKVKKSSFEATMQELEQVVTALEQGDLNLDDALKEFEKGISLVRSSQKELEQAQQKVTLLMQESDELTSFDSGASS
tara:strand:+ start:2376 stop:2612 length:237 start_codon:yes stop_codon:yes gene_type:complete